jgi:HTH-type transcriptional regulator / antitoxin HipB
MTNVSNAQDLGNALRVARKRMGLTQPELSLAAGVGVFVSLLIWKAANPRFA